MNQAEFSTKLKTIQKTIKTHAKSPKGVQILAAVKKRDWDEINLALDAGIKILGENYLQEAEKKYADHPKGKRKFELHMIGTLQNNKVRKALEVFDCIQSVDNYKLAERINKISRELGIQYPVFIQVNLTNDPTRKGFLLEHLETNLPPILALPHLEIRGLMLMAPREYEENKLHGEFRRASELNQQFGFPELSAGMSNDFIVALEEKSTLVRLGSVLFGKRE